MNVWQRRRLSLALIGLATLAVGVSQAVAGSHHHQDLTIQPLKTTCDTHKGNAQLGHADLSYKSDKHVVTATVKLAALPSTTYTLYLLDANTCAQIGGSIGQITTKLNGKGQGRFIVDVSGHGHKFVLNANDGVNDNYTAVYNLG